MHDDSWSGARDTHRPRVAEEPHFSPAAAAPSGDSYVGSSAEKRSPFAESRDTGRARAMSLGGRSSLAQAGCPAGGPDGLVTNAGQRPPAL